MAELGEDFPSSAKVKMFRSSVGLVLAVDVKDLRREFRGKRSTVVALDGANLQVEAGEIFGLLGPNGAGKTTLIRILSTLLLPTSGTATVCGYDAATEPEKVRPVISMASGAERVGYDFITGRGNLWFFSQLYGISSDVARSRIEELSATLGLDGYLDRKLYALSTGYRQRLAIARAFMNDPKVVFLDEPTSGLDVMTAKRIRDFMVKQAQQHNRTIFLATHNMTEGESICDRVAIIDKGRILACDSPATLKRMIGVPAYVMEVTPPTESLDFISSMPGVSGTTTSLDQEREVARVQILAENETVIQRARSTIESRGMKIVSSWRKEPTLEEVFIKLVGSGFTERERLSE